MVSPVAIYGMGGMGKTQLALKYSIEFRDRYAGVWWLRAETDSTLQLDALDCCKLVGAAVADGEAPSLALKHWLGRAAPGATPWLLVFDNAEDPAALRPYLPDRGGHHVLITSRNPAWSGIPRPLATAVWSANQGADFLAHRLPGHASASNLLELRELTDALGGLPLALEQAAAFLDDTGMAASDYTAQVRDYASAPLVLDEGRAATGYARSVLATLSIAFPRLGDEAAQLLCLLAFCAPDPVPERAVPRTARPLARCPGRCGPPTAAMGKGCGRAASVWPCRAGADPCTGPNSRPSRRAPGAGSSIASADAGSGAPSPEQRPARRRRLAVDLAGRGLAGGDLLAGILATLFQPSATCAAHQSSE